MIRIIDLDFWIQKKKQFNDSFQYVENTDLNPFHLPLDIRKEIKEKILNKLDSIKIIPTELNEQCSEVLNLKNMMNNLDIEDKDLPEKYKKQREKEMHPLKIFAKRTEMMDKIRNQDIYSIDTHGYFKRIIDHADRI